MSHVFCVSLTLRKSLNFRMVSYDSRPYKSDARPYNTRMLCCSHVSIGTNLMFGRATASQMASASAASVLLLDVGLHVLRRNQAHFVTKPDKLPRPMVSTRTCFHAHQAGWLFGKEDDEPSTSQLAPKHGVTGRINAVDLKDRLCEIKADRDNGHSGALLCSGWRLKSARSGSRPGRSMPSSGPYSELAK